MNLRLSEKHGVNPSIQKCFLCGKEKGVILFGRMTDDREAPREVVTDKEPCDECKKAMQDAVLFVEVKDGQNGSDNPFRTGYIVGLSVEWAKENLKGYDFDKQRLFFVEENVLKAMLGDKYGIEKENNN